LKILLIDDNVIIYFFLLKLKKEKKKKKKKKVLKVISKFQNNSLNVAYIIHNKIIHMILHYDFNVFIMRYHEILFTHLIVK